MRGLLATGGFAQHFAVKRAAKVRERLPVAPQGQQVAQPVPPHHGSIVIKLHVQRRGHKLPAHVGRTGHAHVARQQKKIVYDPLAAQTQQVFDQLRLAAVVHHGDLKRNLA